MKKSLLLLSVLALYCSCTHSTGSMDNYRNCGLKGDARSERVKRLDELKNRYTFPDSTDFDKTISYLSIDARGEDRDRFNDHKAVDVTAYVYDVKVGGVETCNCHERDPAYRDTHIELVFQASTDDEKQCVVAEVTPRMREIMAEKGIDWSTDHLRNTIKNHMVRVKGWLLFDEEHITQAENTNPENPKDWRATCWEIHPITSIEVIDKPTESPL